MKRIGVSLIVALSVFGGCSDRSHQSVAVFTGGEITEDEFTQRYEQYLEVTGQRDQILLRQEILNNMVSERLMIQDLRTGLFAEAPSTVERLEQIRLQALLDRYARMISIDTLAVSDSELYDEFRAYNSRATARYLYAETESDAWALKRRIDQGASFDELAADVFADPGLATTGGYLGSFGYGEMEPGLEQQAFTLPLGEVSDPFPMRAGYGILRVETREVQLLRSQHDYAKVSAELRHTVLHRKSAELLGAVSREIAESAAPEFNPEAVRLIMRNWEVVRTAGPPEQHLLQDYSARHLVSFNGGSWTIGDFFQKMTRTSGRQQGRVKSEKDLEGFVTGLIVREELLRRALDAVPDDDQQVADQIRIQEEKFRLNGWRSMVLDTVDRSGWDESVLRAAYESRPEFQTFPPQVNVAEVLVRTEKEAVAIADAAGRGADFAALAKEYSIRLWAAERGGELGFGTRADFGILGDRFLEGMPGEIIGPEYVDPYYGVFRILERKNGEPRSYESAREQIIQELLQTRKQDALRAALSRLRDEARVKIDPDRLANMSVTHQPGNRKS